MTTNERPEQRKGSVPHRPDDLPGRPRTEPAGQTGWLDAETAEQLLDAALDASHDDPRVADLARLLASAVEEADPLPGSTKGEQLVLQAFRDTRSAARTAAGPGRRRARWRRPSRPTKVLVGGIAAVSVLSGVALAATTGTLPGPFHTGGGTPTESRSASATSPSAGQPTTTGAGRPTPAPSATTPTRSGQASTHPPTPGGSAVAEPSLKGLCASYLRASQRGAHLDSTAQRRLDAAAGSSADVASYCARLTGEQTPGHGKPTAAAPPVTATPSATALKTPAPRVSRPAAPAVAASPTTSRGHA
jgi:hypothetical protein